ncbi:hypothetical protein C8Q76DRAFT_616779, partial [Earliella scabrosa]
SSTRNTRIERMWVEVGTQFAYQWRAFFTRLERRHHLDPTKPAHLWLLHFLFLDLINQDCATFQDHWNHHPLSGKGGDRSPLDIRFLGQLKHGGTNTHDDFKDVHPDILSQYYGADREERKLHPGQTGAGHSDDEDEDEEGPNPESPQDQALDDLIGASQEHHIRHEAIPVPQSRCPFSPSALDVFCKSLEEIRAAELVPPFYGVAEDEWPEGGYGSQEFISLGRHGRKAAVELPLNVWWPHQETLFQRLFSCRIKLTE